ncbi:MAG TPA: metal ABC transporter permease [bacterium]|nr:metal ABC transporter permease [bacterium]
MKEFFEIFIHHGFIQNAVIAGVLSSFACGITGTFVVIKKISYIAGGIAHAVLGGLGIAYYLGIDPLIGALVFSVLSALFIGLVKLKFSQNEDTVIAALWSIGMAVGIIFTAITPGYKVDLLSFLFGNILMVTGSDLWVLGTFDLVIFLIVTIFYRQLVYVCFDEEYAALRGISVSYIYLLLLCLIAVTVVILIHVVGLILVIALLTLPAAISELFSKTPGKMMVLSILLSILFTFSGLFFSFLTDLPSGASIIIAAGIGYLFALGLTNLLRIFRKKKKIQSDSESIAFL